MNEGTVESQINLIRTILVKKGFSDFTDPQRIAIPEILNGNNVLLTSPTGSGKTEAVVLPIFLLLGEKKNSLKGFGAIYITPLRALNRDVLGRIEFYAESFGLRASVRHGDSSNSERRYQAENPPEVMITTPETMQLILNGKVLRNHLKSVKYLIIDEVHELLNDERGWQLLVAISRIREMAPELKIAAISATVGNPDEVGKAIFGTLPFKTLKAGASKEYSIRVSMPTGAPGSFKEIIGAEDSYAEAIHFILRIYNIGKQFIVFTNTRSTAEDIVMRLRLFDDDISVDVHHGSLGKDVRTKIEDDFRKGRIRGLICTSSMELGIDIGSVDFVIQMNSPRQVIRVVQRVGRGRHRLGEISEGEIVCVNEIEAEEGSVIAEFAQNGRIEKIEIRDRPIIVLVNQLVSLVYAEREVQLDRAYKLFRAVYNFRNLSFDEFVKYVEFLSNLRVIYYDGEKNTIRKSGRTMKQFLENISMIPDEKRYVVKESSTAKIIGFLDEGYVATEIDIESTFVLKGSTWRVVGIKNDVIYVDFIQGISVPPSWSGEEIPVPFEIAFEVGRKRRKGVLSQNLDKRSAQMVQKFIEGSANDELILVEKEGNTTLIQLTGGTKTNYTIALLLTYSLADKYGESFLFDISPYHIMIQGNFRYSVDEIVEGLRNIQSLVLNLDKYVIKTRIFNYSFINVGRKFGIFSKETDFTRIRIDKIISLYEDTIIFKEAVEKFKWDYMDVPHSLIIGKAIEEGTMNISVGGRFSTSSKLYMNNLKEKMMPIRPTAPILAAIRKRLLAEELGFYCLSCRRHFKMKISDLKERRCIFCSSPRIAPVKPYDLDKLDPLSKEMFKRVNTSYHLLRMYEEKALLVLSAHGIGPDSASRILQVPVKSEEELLERILLNEVEFAKNRRFWS